MKVKKSGKAQMLEIDHRPQQLPHMMIESKDMIEERKASLTSLKSYSDENPESPASVEYCHLAHNLRQLLYQYKQYECDRRVTERHDVINRILNLLRGWLFTMMDAKGLRETLKSQPSFRLRQFGSLRLGVQDFNSDIDLCFIAPRWISRDEFFTEFPRLLEQCSNEFSKLSVLPLAYVPVIRAHYNDIGIDIVFARAEIDEISRDIDLLSSATIENLITDIRCVRSLNGYRVTEIVLRFVPRYRVFQLALKAVRYWAKCKKIYSHTLGYLGGVSWAILVAKVCTMFPKAGAARIVNKFFLTMSQWRWPEPVMLTPEGHGMSSQIWSITQMPWDIMPIITPVYPQQNSSFNVSKSTLLVMKNALSEALRVTDAVLLEQISWQPFFQPLNIFQIYDHFIVLQTIRHNLDSHEKELWVMSVERCMKKFLNGIDNCPKCPVEYLHVSPDYSVVVFADHIRVSWLFGVQFMPTGSQLEDLGEHTESLFSHIVSSMAGLAVLSEKDFIRSFFVDRRHAIELMEEASP